MLLAESLWSFGGRAAALPLVAVRPRAGPRVAAATRRRLSKLKVTVIEDDRLSVEYSWWATANKPAISEYAERHARTRNVTWIDGDMMVLREPASFAVPDGFDFIARAGEATDVATSGSDEKAEFWQRLCAQFDLDLEAFPNIISWPDKKPIKAYWQAGLFTYPRSVPFARRFREIKEAMLSGDIASKSAGTYHTDQVALTLAVEALGLRAAEYDPRMNFNINPLDKDGSAKLPINDVQIMQYHGSLWPRDYSWTREFVGILPADRLALLDRHAPLRPGSLITRLGRRFHQARRAGKISQYENRVVRY